MSVEDELNELARAREAAADAALSDMLLEAPHLLRKRLRAYLFRQLDKGRFPRVDEKLPELRTIDRSNELIYPEIEFSSGARLQFNIQLEQLQRGTLMTQFQFHLQLPDGRSLRRIRIELNPEGSRDPFTVPRCHLHVDNSQAHVPFPIMSPLLILHLICEHIEADFGT